MCVRLYMNSLKVTLAHNNTRNEERYVHLAIDVDVI